MVDEVCNEQADYEKVIKQVQYFEKYRSEYYYNIEKIQYLCRMLDNWFEYEILWISQSRSWSMGCSGNSNSKSCFLWGSSSANGCICRCFSLNFCISSFILPKTYSFPFLHYTINSNPITNATMVKITTPYRNTFSNHERSGSLTAME